MWLFACFILVTVIAPTIFFWTVLFVLGLIEHTALPWLSFGITPVLIVFVLLPMAVWLGVGTYRAAARRNDEMRVVLQLLIVTSVLWVPPLAYQAFKNISLSMQSWH